MVVKRSFMTIQAGSSGCRWVARYALVATLFASGLLFSSASAQVSGSNPSQPNPGQTGLQPGTAVPQASVAAPPTDAAKKTDPAANEQTVADAPPLTTTVWQWQGLQVAAIRFEGVTFGPADSLPKELAQQAGQPLDAEKVRQSMRRLFASGRYRTIGVSGVRSGDSVTLIFSGPARFYIGRVQIDGVKDDRLASLLEYTTNLNPGTAYTKAAVTAATELVKQTLAQNGYYQPVMTVATTPDDPNQQMNIRYTVNIGPQARIGEVVVEGTDPGLTVAEFRKKSKLKAGRKVTRETTSDALTKLRAQYQKKDRLEATVALQKSTYDTPKKRLDYDFHANQGPLVKVTIEGTKVSKSRLHLLVPVFEESAVDNDLLNEGSHNIREFMEQQGYFDTTVEVRRIGAGTPTEQVVYSVNRGVKHKVTEVTLKGNKYFETDILRERMQVQKADAYLRSGRYSPALLATDINAIKDLYRANGFDQTEVTQVVDDIDNGSDSKPLKLAQIRVHLTVVEGPQQKFGPIKLAGVDASRMQAVTGMLNSQMGQPFSLVSLSGDRDAVLAYYLSNGFDKVRTEVRQTKDASDPTRTDVVINVDEGHQVFIDHVIVSGDRRTKPNVVSDALQVHAGNPLDQSALLDTQRRLYNLALFNEVNAAVQNPTGDATRKNVLVQLTEAKRWDVTYGFGFEAQTGQPVTGSISPASQILLGCYPNCGISQNGKTGVSPRVSADVSRINLFGTDKSLTLHTTYGLLEKIATLSFNNPHLRGNPLLTASISGGYSNVQNISTFQASTLQGDFRVTQKFRRTDTFIYDFQYRRVAVNPDSLQVSANLIPLLSQPVRVGGPGITWFHDTRNPGPLDASKGSYTSVAEFLASSKFGSQTDFNRVDVSNSTYYVFGKRKYVLARNTRIGYEKAFGTNPNVSNSACAGVLLTTNASCNSVPLPERLYAGGATSHRGFGINDAGPRDLQTGFPVGGSAVVVNSTELRLPAPTLPYVGDNVSFVAFHDMGNVFQNAGDMFSSIKHFKQPDEASCADVSKSVGTCNFNYYSHAVGLGARYKTPVGPIRVDFSYNLDPPKYPIIYDFNGSNPYEGQAGHFNFFFSIGQSF